jgi:hypothetical protein
MQMVAGRFSVAPNLASNSATSIDEAMFVGCSVAENGGVGSVAGDGTTLSST